MSKTTITVSTALPRVPRGTIVKTGNGQLFVVKKQSAMTLTMVPYRWWHGQGARMLLRVLLGFLFGTLISQTILHWHQLMEWLNR